MPQTDLPQPPPTKDGLLDRWLFLLWKKITAASSILWSQIVLPDESANTFLAGPTTGADAQVTFRALVTADLPAGTGTVTSVAQTVPTGFTISGSPITTSGTLALSYAAGYSLPTDASQANWNTAYTDRLKWDGGATDLVAATGRTSLGGTTVGQSYFTLANPSAITFPRMNADNTVSSLNAADFRTAIGAGTGSVTSIDVSGGTTGLTFSGGPITTSGTITLAGTLDADNGGTGQSSYAVGDLLYASTTTALSKLADVSAGSYLRSGGVNTAPLWSTLKLPNAATANRIPYASSTDTWGESANLTFNGSALTLTGTQVISANSSGNALEVRQVGSGNALYIEDSANPDASPVVVTGSGGLVVGATSAQQIGGIIGVGQQFGLGATAAFSVGRFSANSTGTRIQSLKSRAASVGAFSAVQAEDQTLRLIGIGDDGSTYDTLGAELRLTVDGTVSTGVVPMRWGLFCSDTSGAVTELLRGSADKIVSMRTSNSGITTAVPLNIFRFHDLDSSTAADQPIGRIDFYSEDATVAAGVRSYIVSAAKGTSGGGDLRFGVSANGGAVAEFMRLTSVGLRVGAASDPTVPLDVTGAALISSTLGVTGVSSFAAGAVGAPGIYLAADTTSGLYRIGANNIGVAISGAKVLDIASTGMGVTGALSSTTLGVTGLATLSQDRGIRFDNQTSAAAAQVGTITNAPTAGDPGYWLKINVDGTNYSVPCWAG